MSHIKKFIALIMTFVLLVPVFFSSVYSMQRSSGEASQEYAGKDFCASVDKKALSAYLNEQFVSCPKKIDVSSFKIHETEKDISALRSLIWDNSPVLFHVNGLGFTYKNGYVDDIYATYHYTAEEYAKMLERCDAAAEELLYGIKGNNSLNDVMKALLIHDRIILNCEYDFDAATSDDPELTSFEMYGVLVNGKALCKGYSYAYMYLLEKVGIESYVCSSKNLKHDWNIVYINGKPYHVDLTFDDPVYDVSGRVYHENFLLSTAALKKHDHSANDYDNTPKDTTYDNYYWQKSNTAFVLVDNKVYYINNEDETLNVVGSNKPLCSVSDVWLTPEGFYWSGNYSRLATNGVNLLYSKADEIYLYDISSGRSRVVFTPEKIGTPNFAVYGFEYDSGYLVCDTFNKPVFYSDTMRNYQIRYKLDSEPPTARIKYTNDVSAYQTLTFIFNDNMGIGGYYFGTRINPVNNSFIKGSARSVTVYHSEPGTYYLASSDVSNNISNIQSITFISTKLDPNGGKVSTPDILTVKNNGLKLPVPQRQGYCFKGWAKSPSAQQGVTDITASEDAVYYAIWETDTDYKPVGDQGTPKSFSDVAKGSWYEEAVAYCSSKGYINGVSDTNFSPSANLTREQFVVILSNISGVDTNSYKYAASGMKDIAVGKWYSGAIAWSVKTGLVKGVASDRFGLGQPVTREQISRLLFVYAEQNGKNTADRADLHYYTDETKVADWAYEEVQWAVSNGIISGMGDYSISPKSSATRAQAARMFMIYDTIS